MPTPFREEVIPGNLVWQSDIAKRYFCEVCLRWVSSQYEGDESPTMECLGDGAHRLSWNIPITVP